MNKNEFLNQLRENLNKFSSSEVDKIIEYYDELIEEKIESNLTEEEAIASFGDIKNIVNIVSADLIVERTENKSNKTLSNFLIIIGICASPILLPIGISFFAIFISLVVVVLSLILSFSVASIGTLVSVIPMGLQRLGTGVDNSTVILLIGSALIVSGVFLFLTIFTIKIGRYLANVIIKYFSKLISKKAKGEN